MILQTAQQWLKQNIYQSYRAWVSYGVLIVRICEKTDLVKMAPALYMTTIKESTTKMCADYVEHILVFIVFLHGKVRLITRGQSNQDEILHEDTEVKKYSVV